MSAPTKSCPGCQTVMEPFLARGVEIDCCPQCGGLWFDFGKLTQVTGREAEPERIGGHTSRRCAFCRLTLEPALLPGAIPVETCTACRGIYLDDEELEEFAREHVSLTRRDGHPWKKPAPPQGFECVKCKKHFPLNEGNVLRGGLACRSCTPQPQTTEAERRAANREPGLGSNGPDIDLGGGFDFFPD